MDARVRMTSEGSLPEVPADDFVRRFSMRAANLMWLLGAGSSASAGIPTATDMNWAFKQALFVSQRKCSPQMVADLSNPAIRSLLQNHIDSLGNLPPAGAPDEYASLFEVVFPSEADRRMYLDSKIAGAKPSFGHIALATLMKATLCRLVWTTNFDPLNADACAKVYDSTGCLTTVALDAPDLAKQCINEGRWPVEIKLHGDFRSRRLKNTGDELRLQDKRLRQLLVDSCRRFGLVVVGYSGRDSSIMEALNEAVDYDGAFPAGLFWLHRGEELPLPAVCQLLKSAAGKNVEARLVRIENFDEIMRDLLRMRNDIDTTVLEAFSLERRRWSTAPEPLGNCGWPVVRLNALALTQTPTVCRRVVCDIGGYSDVRAAVKAANVDVLVARTRAGVLGFGADQDMRAPFEGHKITDFDLHTIETKRLRYDSGERGLLHEALTRALTRHRGLRFVVRKGSGDLLVPNDPNDSCWGELKVAVGSPTGTVAAAPALRWHEGVGTQLEWADDRLWLLVEPRTVFEGITDENRSVATDFARERTVRRYNRKLNELIAFWAKHLVGNEGEIRALGVSDGVDAVFKLAADTAFSRRSGA